ncbi:unnamed protein product [Phytomonas sp. EM1]|nr:unnamed protein product [Phytomonas sp. EM1]|eukprot:CCW64550.1 unnamed protein product [Phytomonas sp. isolate EM1]
MSCLIQTLYRRLLKQTHLFDLDARRCMLLCSQVEIARCKLPFPLQTCVETTIRDVFHRGSHFYFPIAKSGTDKDISAVPSLKDFLKRCFATYPATSINIQNAFACLQRLQTINHYFDKEGNKQLVLSSFREYCRCVSSQLMMAGTFTVAPSQHLLPFNFDFLRFSDTDTHAATEFQINEGSSLVSIRGTFPSCMRTVMTCITNKVPDQLESNVSRDIDRLACPSTGVQILLAHPNVRNNEMFAVVLLVSVSLCCKEAVGFVLNAAPPLLANEVVDASPSCFRQKLGRFLQNGKGGGIGPTADADPLCSAKCITNQRVAEGHPIFAELCGTDSSIYKEMGSSYDRAFSKHGPSFLTSAHLIHCVPDTPGATPLSTGMWLDGDKDFLLGKLCDGTALKEDFIVVHRNSIRHWTHDALQKEILEGKWLLLQSTVEECGNDHSEVVKEVVFTLTRNAKDDSEADSNAPQFDLFSPSFSHTHSSDNEHIVATPENMVEYEGDKEFSADLIESAEIDDGNSNASVKEATIISDNTGKDDIIETQLEGAVQLSKIISEDSAWSRYYILDQLDPEDLEVWSIMAAWSTADGALTSMEKSWRLMYYILGSPFDVLAVQRTFVPLPMLDEDEEDVDVSEWHALALRES